MPVQYIRTSNGVEHKIKWAWYVDCECDLVHDPFYFHIALYARHCDPKQYAFKDADFLLIVEVASTAIVRKVVTIFRNG